MRRRSWSLRRLARLLLSAPALQISLPSPPPVLGSQQTYFAPIPRAAAQRAEVELVGWTVRSSSNGHAWRPARPASACCSLSLCDDSTCSSDLPPSLDAEAANLPMRWYKGYSTVHTQPANLGQYAPSITPALVHASRRSIHPVRCHSALHGESRTREPRRGGPSDSGAPEVRFWGLKSV